MPRIAIILALLFSSPALAASCGERVMAYTAYEDYDDQLQVEHKVSVFPVPEFSPDSAFGGLLVKKKEDPKLKVTLEVLKNGAVAREKSWDFSDEELKEGFRATEEMNASEFLGFRPGSFRLRLTLNGKTVCEDTFAIQSGD